MVLDLDTSQLFECNFQWIKSKKFSYITGRNNLSAVRFYDTNLFPQKRGLITKNIYDNKSEVYLKIKKNLKIVKEPLHKILIQGYNQITSISNIIYTYMISETIKYVNCFFEETKQQHNSVNDVILKSTLVYQYINKYKKYINNGIIFQMN